MPGWRALFRFSKKRSASSHPQTSPPLITPPADTPTTNPAPGTSSSTKGLDHHRSSPPSETPSAQSKADKVSTGVANGLKLALRLLKEAVTGIGVPGLEAAVSGVVKVIDIIENVHSNDRDLEDLSHRISSVADAVGKSAKFHPNEEVSEALRLRMEAFLNELEFMLFKVNAILSDRNLASRTANSQPYQNAITDVNTRIDRLISQFSAEGIIHIEMKVDGVDKKVEGVDKKVEGVDRKVGGVDKKVDGVDQKVDNVQEKQIMQEYEALIEKVPRIHARYNDTSTKPSRPCHRGTRTNLLEGISKWIEGGSDDAPYLWLCGEVGVGKTTVAHTIAKEQEGLKQLGASFFFSRHERDRQAPHLLFPSLAYQLSRFDRGVWKALAEVLKPDPDIVNRGLTEQFTKLILEPLSRSGMSSSRTVVIVIDGLDECSDPASVLDALALGVEYVSVRFRVLVCSRPYAVIQSKFKNTPLYHLATQNHFHDINPSTLSSDVAAYLTWSLREIASRPANRRLPSPWPSEDELTELISRASRLFIVASTYTKYIDDPFEDNPAAQLKRILSRKRGIGSSPLAELDALYDQVLDDLKQSLRRAGELNVAQEIIETIILARSEMSITACSVLLRMEPSDVWSVLRRLTAVILLPEDEDAAVTPFHASFGEYIQDETRCTVRELAVSTVSAHGRIAGQCMATMALAAENGILGVEYPSSTRMPLHLIYASLSLADHISNSSFSPAGGGRNPFIQNGIWTWLNLLHAQSSSLDEIKHAVERAGFESLFNIKTPHADTKASIGRLMIARHIQAINGTAKVPSQLATSETDFSDAHQSKVTQVIKFGYTILDDILKVVVDARRCNIHNYSNFFIENIAVDLDAPSEVRMVVRSSTRFRGLRTLDRYLEERSDLDATSKVRLALEVAKDVRYLHETSPLQCHGWLVPNRILMSVEGKPIFGYPQWIVLGDSEGSTSGDSYDCLMRRTDIWYQVVEDYWFRPEISQHYDIRLQHGQQFADIWEFGCLLFQIMTTIMPIQRYKQLPQGASAVGYEMGWDHFWHGSLEAHIYQIRFETAVSLLLDTFEGSEEVKAVLKGCWALNPEDRSSMRLVVEQLEAIVRTAEDET